MIDDELRDLMPAEQRLSSQRKHRLKERVMHNVRTDQAPTEKRRITRRFVIGIAAVALATTAGVAAATELFDRPDPDQAAQVVENNLEAAAVHLDGWRPELRAESVACIGPDDSKLSDPREIGNTFASEFPLEEPLTEDLLIEECTIGNDWARSVGPFDPMAASVCVRDGSYPLAVVALEGLPCADTGIDIDVRPIEPGDLTELNRMRAVEVAILANPDECPTPDGATAWVRSQLDLHSGGLEIVESGETGEGCYGSWTHWELGHVLIGRVSYPASELDDTSGTQPPTTTVGE